MTIAIKTDFDNRVKLRYWGDTGTLNPLVWTFIDSDDWPDTDPDDGEAYYYNPETATVEIRSVETQ